MKLEAALAYPMENDEWKETVLLGGGLLIVGVLVVPYVLALGYVFRVLRERLDGVSAPPTFGDWNELAADGARSLVILLAYQLIPLLVLVVLAGGSLVELLTDGSVTLAGLFDLMRAIGVSAILAVVFGYVGVAGLVNFAAEDTLADAFDFGTIREVVTSSQWLLAWVYVVVLGFALAVAIWTISLTLSFVPYAGMIAAVFAGFYIQIVFAYLWAEGYTNAVGERTTAGGVGPPA